MKFWPPPYPWLLSDFSESLSSFPKDYWQQSPSHTNLVENAHVASNNATKINLIPVEARIYDARETASIRAARETCILTNRNNSDQVRMRCTVTRAAKRHSYRQEHDEVGDAITMVQESLNTLLKIPDAGTTPHMTRPQMPTTSMSAATPSRRVVLQGTRLRPTNMTPQKESVPIPLLNQQEAKYCTTQFIGG
ncbi:hypothetical protein K438DRAFT_1763162 [Mycena galopus ATCC 62051]|nr:hypothetical protein K438DRAFT_1763162 [Mycena galopus ATCC 62051]